MGYISDGLQLFLNPATFRAVWGFDQELHAAKRNMQLACEAFFENAGYQATVQRTWNVPAGGILFVSDHTSSLDGFALSLACPQHLQLRRVIFLITGYVLGRTVARQSVLVWPRGNFHNLVHETHGFVDRVAYVMTHRWGSWVRPNRALHNMCQTLADGQCLSLLPSGTVGEQHWRSGVGAIVQTALRISPKPSVPFFLAPIYIDWQEDPKLVSVSAPGLISFEDIIAQAGANLGRAELTRWLKQRYVEQSWQYTTPVSPRQA